MEIQTVAFFNGPYPYGGGEIVTRNLSQFFRKQGLRVVLFTQKLNRDLLTQNDYDTFIFKELPNGETLENPINTQFLSRTIREEKIDVLISQGTVNLPFKELRQTTSCKLIYCLHNKPLWEIDFNRQQSLAEKNLSGWAKKAEYVLLRKPIYLFTNKLHRRFARWYYRMAQQVDRIIMLCPEYRTQMQQILNSLSLPPISPEHFGAILNPMLPVKADRSAQKEKIVLYVGRLVKTHKRVDRLLTIWKKIEQKHPDWQLQLVGTGEEESALKEYAHKLGLRHAQFVGYQSDVSPYYKKATFCCLTSNVEGLPMSLMEGQQYGVIPISFDTYAGIHEITKDGEAGIIVPPFKLGQYAKKLGLMMEDTCRQEQMRAACYKAAERYDLDQIGEQWLELFKSL